MSDITIKNLSDFPVTEVRHFLEEGYNSESPITKQVYGGKISFEIESYDPPVITMTIKKE